MNVSQCSDLSETVDVMWNIKEVVRLFRLDASPDLSQDNALANNLGYNSNPSQRTPQRQPGVKALIKFSHFTLQDNESVHPDKVNTSVTIGDKTSSTPVADMSSGQAEFFNVQTWMYCFTPGTRAAHALLKPHQGAVNAHIYLLL